MLLKQRDGIPFLLVMAAIYVFAWFVQENLFLNWDVAYLLHATTLMLRGGSYTSDFFTPNPPMIFYLYTPPVIFSKLTHLSIILVFRIYVFLLCTFSLALCYPLVKGLFSQKDRALPGLFLLALAALFLLLPVYDFGQRDPLFFMFSVPYLLAAAWRMQGNNLDRRVAFVIGLLAGAGFAIKPQFLVMPFLIECYCLLHKKKLTAWARTETVTIGCLLSLYAMTVFLFYPDFIFVILPYLMQNYYGSIGKSWSVLTMKPATLFCFMPILLYFARYRRQDTVCTILLIALTGFLLSYYLQHTVFQYHLIPALSAAFLLSVVLFYQLVIDTSLTYSDYIKICLLALAFAAVNIYLSRNFWTLLVFSPYVFYVFFAILFSLLLYIVQRDKQVLPALLGTMLILACAYLFSSLILATPWYPFRFSLTLITLAMLYALVAMRFRRNLMHHLLTAALGISLFLVPSVQEYTIFLTSLDYRQNVLNRMIAFMHSRPSGQSIYVFSNYGMFSFPLIYYANASFSQRFDCMWPIAGLIKQAYLDKTATRQQYIQNKKYIIDMIADDLDEHKPDLIFVDMTDINDILGISGFNYLNFFSDNQKFAGEWKSYRYLTTLHWTSLIGSKKLEIYQRMPS